MEKMTIHRGLAELKLIDSRIEKGIKEINPTGMFQKGKAVNGLYTEEQFKKDAKSKLDSVTALINRKNLIKSAIVEANGKTMVKIGDSKMSIADAINFRNVVTFKRSLINTLSQKHNEIVQQRDANNVQVENNSLKLAEAALGKDNVKIGADDVNNIVKPFKDTNEFHLLDPLGVEALVDGMSSEVDEFETEVDAVLSEINAVTIIEIKQ